MPQALAQDVVIDILEHSWLQCHVVHRIDLVTYYMLHITYYICNMCMTYVYAIHVCPLSRPLSLVAGSAAIRSM